MLARFGLIGDVHAEDVYLRTALDCIQAEGVERILCVGDIVDGRGDVERCVRLLRAERVETVRGNHDRWLLTNLRKLHEMFALAPSTREFLANLPPTRVYDSPLGPMMLCHGIGKDDMAFLPEVGAGLRMRGKQGVGAEIRVMVGGHTHRSLAKRYGRLLVINAGTLKFDEQPCFSIVDLEVRVVRFFCFEDGNVKQEKNIII